MRGAIDPSPKTARLSGAQQSFSQCIIDSLPYHVCALCGRLDIQNGALYYGDGNAFMLSDILVGKIGAMNHDPCRALPAKPCGLGNGEMNAGRIQIRDSVDEQRRFMGQSDVLRTVVIRSCP